MGGNIPLELLLKLCRQVHDSCGSALPPTPHPPHSLSGVSSLHPPSPQVRLGPRFHAPRLVPLTGEQRSSEKKGWKIWGEKNDLRDPSWCLVGTEAPRAPWGCTGEGLGSWPMFQLTLKTPTHPNCLECGLLTLAGRLEGRGCAVCLQDAAWQGSACVTPEEGRSDGDLRALLF